MILPNDTAWWVNIVETLWNGKYKIEEANLVALRSLKLTLAKNCTTYVFGSMRHFDIFRPILSVVSFIDLVKDKALSEPCML